MRGVFWGPVTTSESPSGPTTVGLTTYTTSVSTYNDGTNPSHYQQQIVTATPTP
jgi:hypothetical protein